MLPLLSTTVDRGGRRQYELRFEGGGGIFSGCSRSRSEKQRGIGCGAPHGSGGHGEAGRGEKHVSHQTGRCVGAGRCRYCVPACGGRDSDGCFLLYCGEAPASDIGQRWRWDPPPLGSESLHCAPMNCGLFFCQPVLSCPVCLCLHFNVLAMNSCEHTGACVSAPLACRIGRPQLSFT